MSLSDIPKLWTEQTKIGHICQKISLNNISWSPYQIVFTKVFFGKIQPILDTEKSLWTSEFWDLWQGCS